MPNPGSRVCFATMSNFAVMLLIQAPNRSHAAAAKRIVDEWRDTARTHNQSFGLVKLGLLRLNAMHFVGLKELTRATPWAHELMDINEQH